MSTTSPKLALQVGVHLRSSLTVSVNRFWAAFALAAERAGCCWVARRWSARGWSGLVRVLGAPGRLGAGVADAAPGGRAGWAGVMAGVWGDGGV